MLQKIPYFSAMPILLVTLSCIGRVFASDTAPIVSLSAPPPTMDYLLTMGPYGALAFAAYILGGVTKTGIPLRIEIEPDTLKVFENLVETISKNKQGR